jgi:aspartyl-tRNA(Asn)/glutamyl-tRNA(Gln) amidotransferase subunit B
MNSFRAVFRALEYEGERQRKVISQGGRLAQETRGWVEPEGKTVSQRSKEFAHDYRYFPEPDLPPITPSPEWIEHVRSMLPELPEDRLSRFVSQYGLPIYDANLLTENRGTADYYELLVRSDTGVSPKEISNWLVGATASILNTSGCDIIEFGRRVSPQNFTALVRLVSKAVVNAGTGKVVLEEMFNSGKAAQAIINEKGLGQISDTSELETAALQVIRDNPQAVSDFKAGKAQAVKFMVGQLMRLSKGRANPNMASEIITRKLGEL